MNETSPASSRDASTAGSVPGVGSVLLMSGSPSDLDHVLDCQDVLDGLGIPSQIRVASAHRTPDRAAEIARNAQKEGFSVLITFAGLAAHLGGVAAAHSRLPVIQVPIASGPLSGVEAALASLQMPPGTPLAAVAIDGARNAALLAARILALGNPPLAARLEVFDRESQKRYDPQTIDAEIARRKALRAKR